jgi:hypothetical protein
VQLELAFFCTRVLCKTKVAAVTFCCDVYHIKKPQKAAEIFSKCARHFPSEITIGSLMATPHQLTISLQAL